MKGNHEFNIRQGLCLVMIGLISVVEASLISVPPLFIGENLRVFVDCQSWARELRLDQNQEKWMSLSAFEQDYRSRLCCALYGLGRSAQRCQKLLEEQIVQKGARERSGVLGLCFCAFQQRGLSQRTDYLMCAGARSIS